MGPSIVANATPENSSAESAQAQSAQQQGAEASKPSQTSQTPSTNGPAAPATQIPATGNPASGSKETATSADAAKTGAASKETTGQGQSESKDSKNAEPQAPSAQSAPQPAAQGGEATVPCGTLRSCFPNQNFRKYLKKFINTTQYPNPTGQTGWGIENKDFAEDFPVTQSWLDSITAISSDGIPNGPNEGVEITDVRGIELFRNLKSFNTDFDSTDPQETKHYSAGFYALTDYSPLASANMPNLETLKLNNFNGAVAQSCRNFTAAKAPKLANIYTYDVDHAFSDVSMFYGLPQLKTLSLGNTNVGLNGASDVQAIVDHFPDLESLSFSNAYHMKAKPESVLPLKNLKHLTSFGFVALFLYQNTILNYIAQLPYVTDLDLSSDSIFDLSFLSGMTNLKTLNINDNEITDLRPLVSLSNLEHVQAVNEIPRVPDASIIDAGGTARFDYSKNYNIDGTVPALNSIEYGAFGLMNELIPQNQYTNDTVNHIITIPSINQNKDEACITLLGSIIHNGKNLGSLQIILNHDFHNPQVTFDFRGGRTPNGYNTTTAPRNTPYGQKLPAMWHPWMFNADGSRDETNNLFQGWVACPTDRSINTDYDFSQNRGTPYTDGCTFEKAEPFDYTNTVMTHDWTLFALWSSDSYDVTFDSQGGPAIAKQHIMRFKTATEPTDSKGNAPVFTDGKGNTHALLGWYTSNGSKYDFTQPVKEPITLHARWEGITTTYTVRYLSESGSQISSETVYEGEKATNVPNPGKKDGYKFDGWYEQGATTPFDFGTQTITRDVTVYEHWTQNQNNGGGSGNNNNGNNNNNGGSNNGNNNGGNSNNGGGSGNNNGGGSNNGNGNNNGNNTNNNGGIPGPAGRPGPMGPAGSAFASRTRVLGNPRVRVLNVTRNTYIGAAPNAATTPAPVPAQQQNDQSQDNSSKSKQPKKKPLPVCPEGYVLEQSSYFENTDGSVEMAKINPKCVLANQTTTQAKQHHSFMWLWWLLLLLLLVLVALYAYHRYEKNKEEDEQPEGSQHVAY
ncbi:InlB B-repeat-containing protein [Bifidobacterium sp. ESL0728]|uniref:InlB B-repeat-containing protein n=1 Tax=Bifidobacterium sp. ESL0728 TaxID=2983220 RepID=UPI0023F7D902|nr:InlB B-repeat-containing protein [Bifidobacterium sp. ESL0728]WEV59104.1 InlB B-repeat-containing protein [Bifidobacterium sp. ESL0728]